MDAQLKRGLLDVCVLAAISGGESYGYKIIKDMQPYLRMSESTLYTILKRLCERGIFKNEHGTVSSIISKEEFYALQSEKFVDETFDGSLPAFLAAFSKRKKLSEKEVDELRQVIESMKE